MGVPMRDGRVSTSRWPTPGEALLATLAALVILAISFGGAQRSRLLTLERRETEDRAVVGEIAVALAGGLERSIAEAQAGGGAISGASLIQVRRGDPAVACSAEIPPPLDDQSIAQLIRRACDSGEAELGDPVDLGDQARFPVATASYGSTPGLVGASGRRAAVQGWTLAMVDVEPIVRRSTPRDTAVRLRTGDVVLAMTSPDAEGLPEQVIDVAGQRLVLQAGDRDPVPWTAPTIGLVVGGIGAAAIAATAVAVVGRRRREHQAERARAYEQVRLVGEIAPLVQQSLELADVLPAVAVQLGDHFGLAGIRLSTGTTSAGQVELFSLGVRPISASPVLVPPERLEAGQTLTLALQRGGRSVALLQILAGRDLDAGDLESLRAITELITAAVVNAALYASQQESVRRLRELDGLKTVFLSTASHELRTPATAIGGFASLLSGSWDRFDDAQRREFAGRIAANARSLGAVVQDLLDFSLLDRGRLHLSVAAVDLGALVEGVVDRLGPAIPEHGVVSDIEEALLVSADPDALERIVTNLMTNAAKFSPPGSTITVGVRASGDGAVLSVSDEGHGVPEEERERIFTRFYRGSGEAVVKTRGVGIGLSVVSELTDRMGGSVTIDDAPGGGARFCVHLPAARDAAHIEELDDASTA